MRHRFVAATEAYVREVQSGEFPSAAQSFGATPKKQPALETGQKPVLPGAPKTYGPAGDDS